MRDLIEEIDKLKEEIDRIRPLKRNELKQIREYFRIGLTYTSNALEGNSLTETETKIVIEEGITIGGKPLKDHYEAIGHSEAYDLLYRLAKTRTNAEEDVRKLHKLFYLRIDSKNAGRYRKERVTITGSKFPLPSPGEIPDLMKKFTASLPDLRKKLHAVEFAGIAHKELVFIHPFVDGNGRISRLLMNLILLQEGYTMTIIPPILRNEYIQTLEKAHEDDKDFMRFIAQLVKESQKDYLRLFK